MINMITAIPTMTPPINAPSIDGGAAAFIASEETANVELELESTLVVLIVGFTTVEEVDSMDARVVVVNPCDDVDVADDIVVVFVVVVVEAILVIVCGTVAGVQVRLSQLFSHAGTTTAEQSCEEQEGDLKCEL